jgi:hypothetical protein
MFFPCCCIFALKELLQRERGRIMKWFLAITVYFVNHYLIVFYSPEENEVAGTSNQHL